MTGVYSGGLVYEYSEEKNKYGLVKIDGDKVQKLPDFDVLKNALAATKAPSGDGGYKSNGATSQCPAKSNVWEVDLDSGLPAIPDKAKGFMGKGAGKGPGLSGAGSQNAGTGSTGIAPGNSRASPTNKPNAATPQLSFVPFAYGMGVLVSFLMGSILL